MEPTIKLTLRAAAAIFLALMLAPLVQAQRDNSARERDMREREIQEQEIREAYAREAKRKALEQELGKPAGRRELRKPNAQVSADFLRLQVVNDELMQAVARGGAPDFKFVAKSASEIKKLAARLKLNLMLPAPRDGRGDWPTGDAEDVGRLKSSLASLDKLILAFVRSPVFKNAKIFDAELSVKAGQDLEGIIELSERVKKGSEHLGKAAGKER